jgi:hypothetical protein
VGAIDGGPAGETGDRKLNHALYMMAIVQICHPTAGQAYFQRKHAEGSRPRRRFGA